MNWSELVLQVEPQMPNEVQLRQLQEHIQVLEREQVELINVPVPEFEDGDPAKIVHDFQRVRHPQAQLSNFPFVPSFTVELLAVCVYVSNWIRLLDRLQTYISSTFKLS